MNKSEQKEIMDKCKIGIGIDNSGSPNHSGIIIVLFNDDSVIKHSMVKVNQKIKSTLKMISGHPDLFRFGSDPVCPDRSTLNWKTLGHKRTNQDWKAKSVPVNFFSI